MKNTINFAITNSSANILYIVIYISYENNTLYTNYLASNKLYANHCILHTTFENKMTTFYQLMNGTENSLMYI